MEEKYSDTYDQPKEADDGYIDEDESPHRYLKGWYLCHQDAPEKRVPLPQKRQFFDNKTILRGWLQPPEGAPIRIKPVLIEIQDLYFYSMDRSPEYRGYWIQSTDSSTTSTNALYWLQEPEALSRETINGMAQEEVHFPARMTLAIVSAMCERVFCGRLCDTNVDKTVDEVLRAFPLLKTKNVSPDELFLFERRVLAKYQHAVHMHLSGYIPDKLEPSSTFLRSLIRLQPENHKLAATELERWADAIERQCKQNSWGGSRDSSADSATKSKSMNFFLEKDRRVVEKVIKTTTVPDFAGSLSAVLLMKDSSNLDNAGEVVATSKDSTGQQEPGSKRVREEKNNNTSNKLSRRDSQTGGIGGSSDNDEGTTGMVGLSLCSCTAAHLNADNFLTILSLCCCLFSNGIQKYLMPKPGISHFNLVVDQMQDNGYYISANKEQANEFFVKLADFELGSTPLEWAFLAVASLNHSFSIDNPSKEYVDNLRGLFKVKRKDGRWLAQIVFHDFRNYCLGILRKPDPAKGECEGTTAMHLLKAIVSLIPSCCLIIKHKGHYEKILERGINWEQTTTEVRAVLNLLCSSHE